VRRREGEKRKKKEKTRGLLSPVSSSPVSSENKRGKKRKKKKTRGLLSPVSSWPISSENKRGNKRKRKKLEVCCHL
jgi:hypothetical protein